jgi:hypothetical protein
MPLLTAADTAALATAIGTLVLAVVTIIYVRLTHQLVRIQTEPCVVVYAQSRPDLGQTRRQGTRGSGLILGDWEVFAATDRTDRGS